MSVRKGSRTKARIRAIDVLFEADERFARVTSADIRQMLEERKHIFAAQTPLPEYSITIVEGVANHLDEIDNSIDAYSSRNWRRMPSIDRSILRVAIWEILFNDDVDSVVSITEAVGISDSLCASDAPAYINAVLDKVKNLAGQKEGVFLDELSSEDTEVDVADAYEGEYLDD
ncbi:transcription antitermination factor NusB [Actinomycetaceae bacterium TAE3-ERU4]|nr:transcription antitermination factor NusB [Actinomycetaceae bacterium TAE3-ERU4]